MTLPVLQATVDSVRMLTPDVREVTLLLAPHTVDFQAGQYIYLTIPPAGPDQRLLKRAYSICSAPHQRDRISLLANLVPNGPGSHYLFALKAGDPVQISAPTGQFVVETATTRDYLFVAIGTGIAPLRAMILHLCDCGVTKPIRLVWGLRSERDIYYQEFFHDVSQQYPNFTFDLTLSQPTAAWRGLKGRVTQVLPELVDSVNNVEVYLCGHQTMIQDVKTVLRTKGLCPIHVEKYY